MSGEKDKLEKEIINITESGNKVFPGNVLFNFKATNGFPLDLAIHRIIAEAGLAIGWVDFIEAARSNKWYDFQTYEVITHALEDAMLPKPYIEGVKTRFQAYVLANPLVS